jgi:hypothetical protein
MYFIEALLMWARSLQAWLGDQGVTLQYGESPSDRLTRSCWLNVRRGDREAEVLLWESGEAEFNFKAQQASVIQEHHEFGQVGDLAVVLARLLGVIAESNPTQS